MKQNNKIDSSKLIQLSTPVRMDFYEKIDHSNVSKPITKEGIPTVSLNILKNSQNSINNILYNIGLYEHHCKNLENKEYSEFDKKVTEETESSFNMITKECVGIFRILTDMKDLLWNYKRTRDEDYESSILKNLNSMNNSLITVNDICSELFTKRIQRKEIMLPSINFYLTGGLLLIRNSCIDMLTNNLVEIPN